MIKCDLKKQTHRVFNEQYNLREKQNGHRLVGVYVATQKVGGRLDGGRHVGKLSDFYVATRKKRRRPTRR
jgi:hypothetical protein